MVAGRRPSGGPIRHNNPSVKFTDVLNVPYKGKVPVHADPDWHEETKEWWSFVRKMPHCVLWSDTDWRYAKDTGHVHNKWMHGRESVLTELRQREAKMGTTYDARLSIRVRWVDEHENTDDASVSQLRRIK